ncbi:MAG TPA: Crp/Fnr family transcriptional regulator [Spirochaetota bacterium]|nr:Crp/Fnr family transcriptional regulator [Spirochaetota bacterium]HPN11789.1 Crp/Fnr family transcriptional regulator [Spirochaetota bacterium]HQL81880.1 Crp/Fnr family transcriptional regulator [Spirochaetota bacterium]
MNGEYREKLARSFPLPGKDGDALFDSFSFREVSRGRPILSAGETATELHVVLRGCLRTYFLKEDGTEITSQFFLEGQMVASFESAMTGTPSNQYIEAIEDSVIASIRITALADVIRSHEAVRNYFNIFLMKRLIYYMNHYSSYILDNPEKRYTKLLEAQPELASRVPQQYIASYLGITPVSLSRIKSRLKKSG